MKKVLTALIMFVAAISVFGLKTNAAGTGNLVIHYHAWDGDYTELGSWAWGGPAAGKVYTGLDDFGAYWEYNDIPLATEVGFIAVDWPGGAGPNWDAKHTGDIFISPDAIIEGKTTHVYVFEGAATVKEGDVVVDRQNFVANPDQHNVMVVYYDPANAYAEELGIHGWGWEGPAGSSAWGTPTQVLSTAGVAESGYPVKGFMLSAAATASPGFLMYAGDDATKKTGDLKSETGFFTTLTAGTTEFLFIVNAGDSFTDNSNVFTDAAQFAEEAFSFKLKPFTPEDMSGTFAQNPTDIYVETSAAVASPYPSATDKEAAKAEIQSWFTVKEKTGENTYGPALAIERVDFALSAETLNTFVIVLEEGSALDNTKEYEVFFDLGLPSETLAVAKTVEVTLELTAPANTPVDAVLSVAGGFQGWSPNAAGYTATKVGDIYTVTFNVDVTEPFTTFEYKWTRGDWPNAEFVEGNRSLVVPNNVDSITVQDEVLIWEDLKAETDTKYAAPVRVAGQNIAASIAIEMDREAPVLTFISPSGILGKPATERIIEVAWGTPFDQNLFPGYRVVDNRDGDLTPLVFVPKGANSVLDTRTEGDYTIMLQVEDKWGNVTQETFIFRVVKK